MQVQPGVCIDRVVFEAALPPNATALLEATKIVMQRLDSMCNLQTSFPGLENGIIGADNCQGASPSSIVPLMSVYLQRKQTIESKGRKSHTHC